MDQILSDSDLSSDTLYPIIHVFWSRPCTFQ